VFLGLSGLVIIIILWVIDRQHYEITDNAYLKANIILLSPKVQGYVNHLYITDNQSVKKGQLLLTIEDRDYQAKVLQAQAMIEVEMANAQRLKMIKLTQQSSIQVAKANITVAEAKLEPVTKDVQRFTQLIANGSAPVQTLENLTAQSKQAQAELNSQQSTLTVQQQQLLTLDSEMMEIQARIKNAKAQLQLAQLDWEYTQIRSPIDGIIGNRGVQLGQFIRPGMGLASLVAHQSLWIEANFKETQLTHMQIGQPVTIHIDAYPNQEFHGRIESFSPASGAEFSLLPSENATGNFTKIVRRIPVKITFAPNSDLHLLKAGFSAEVKVKVK
jgi:membrane fusion protein (multidrug efflux system)